MEHLSLFRMALLDGSTYSGIIPTGFLSTTWEILASECYFVQCTSAGCRVHLPYKNSVSADLKLIRFKKVGMLLNNPCSSQNCMMRAKMNELFNPFSFTNLKHQGQIFCCSVTFKKFIRWMMFLSRKPHNPSKKRLCLLFRTPLSSLVTSWCLQSGVLEPGQTWICKDKFHVGCKEIKWYLPNAALTLWPVPVLGSAPGEPGMAHTLLSLPSCSSLKQTPRNSRVL